MRRISWNRELVKLSAIFFTIYFVQGMSSLPGLPINYLIKNVLKLNPADAQFFSAVTMLAWLVKPVWGYISDTFPVLGYRRKSYLMGMSLTAASSWFLLAWFASNNDYRYWTLLILFNFSAMAYAFVDVVCDGLMVENGKRVGLIDQFVNIQWIGAGTAGVIVGLVSGHISKIANTRPDFYATIFFIAGVVPLVTALLVLLFLKEEPVKTSFPWLKFSVVLSLIAGLAFSLLKAMPALSSLGVGISIVLVGIAYLLLAVIVWFWTGRPKMFWMINAFIFFWGFSPSVGMASFYYKSDVLKFSEQFFGWLGAIDSVFSIAGFMLYAYILVKCPAITRRQYLYFSIILASIGLGFSYLYYLDPALGINLYVIAISSAIFFSLLGAPGFIIPLAIAGDVSKDGKEAMTYAWFMSMSNFSRLTFSDLTGGWLYQVLEKTDFSGLSWLIGTADFLGPDANKALILRLFVWIGALFTILAIPVVYFLKSTENKDKADN